jgi:hypothetical protein
VLLELPIGRDDLHLQRLTLAAGGDLDGDGVGELVVGEPGGALDPRGGGSVLVISPGRAARIATVHGPGPQARFGETVAFVDDLDGDGTPEIAVGAPSVDGGRGEIRILSGASLATLRAWRGDLRGARLGASLDAWGDLDGDGRRELVAGAPGVDSSAMRRSVFVLDPRQDRARLRIDAPRYLGPTTSVAGYAFGNAVATPDLDGDGLSDLAIGAPRLETQVDAGRVFALSGAELRTKMDGGR